MPKFPKILIPIFLALFVGGGFAIFQFSNAQNEGSAEGTIYICPEAASLTEVNPRCPNKIILRLGETINGLTLTTTNYEGQDYYMVLGFTNGGGAVNLPPTANAGGPYEGYAGLSITLDASSSTDPNNDPLQYRWDFNDDGIWDTDWLAASTINHIWNNDYEGIVKLEVSDGEFTAIVATSVKVISPKTLKQDAISELKSAKTGNKIIDQKISLITGYIQNSLDNGLWLDASHLIFSKKDCSDSEIIKFSPDGIDIDEMFELESQKMELEMGKNFKGKCFTSKLGIKVFYNEYAAVKLMINDLNRSSKIPEKLKSIFKEATRNLVKADQLLVKISLFDVKNTSIQNQKLRKMVESQIGLAEKELQKADSEMSKSRSDKAILRLAKSWLYSQIAIKFANLK